MRSCWWVAALALALAGLPSVAGAQAIRNRGTTRAQVQLGFNGLVSGSLQLIVVGIGPTTMSNTSNSIMPTPARGTVDFGSFTTLNPVGALNADRFRATAGPSGAIVAARLQATLVYNGATTGTVSVVRLNPAGAAPDVPLQNLRVASPPLASWSAGSDGTQVPNAGAAGFDLCTAQGDTTCINDKSYDHQLAIFVPDTQLAGPFSTVVVYQGVSP